MLIKIKRFFNNQESNQKNNGDRIVNKLIHIHTFHINSNYPIHKCMLYVFLLYSRPVDVITIIGPMKKIGARFHSKIIKSFNKKKTLVSMCWCVFNKDITHTNMVCMEKLHAHKCKLYHECKDEIFSSFSIYFSFTTFSFSSLISYQLDLTSSGSGSRELPKNKIIKLTQK
jgi:hypothetical protein